MVPKHSSKMRSSVPKHQKALVCLTEKDKSTWMTFPQAHLCVLPSVSSGDRAHHLYAIRCLYAEPHKTRARAEPLVKTQPEAHQRLGRGRKEAAISEFQVTV